MDESSVPTKRALYPFFTRGHGTSDNSNSSGSSPSSGSESSSSSRSSDEGSQSSAIKPKIKKQKLLSSINENGCTLDTFMLKSKPLKQEEEDGKPVKLFGIFQKRPSVSPSLSEPTPSIQVPVTPIDTPMITPEPTFPASLAPNTPNTTPKTTKTRRLRVVSPDATTPTPQGASKENQQRGTRTSSRASSKKARQMILSQYAPMEDVVEDMKMEEMKAESKKESPVSSPDTLSSSMTKISVSDAIAQPIKASEWTQASRSYVPPLKPLPEADTTTVVQDMAPQKKQLNVPWPDRYEFYSHNNETRRFALESPFFPPAAPVDTADSFASLDAWQQQQGRAFLHAWRDRWDRDRPLFENVVHVEPLDAPMSSDALAAIMDSLYPEETTGGWRYPVCERLLELVEEKSSQWQPLQQGTWCDKYLPDKVAHLLDNHHHHGYLRDWLERHKVHDKHETEKKRKKPTRRQMESHYAYVVREEDDNDDDFIPLARRSVRKVHGSASTRKSKSRDGNMCLLVGANGIGKTASVFTAAHETGYQVFEVHAGLRRGYKEIMHLVGDMTRNHLVHFSHSAKKKAPPLRILSDDDEDNDQDTDSQGSTTADEKETDEEQGNAATNKKQLLTSFFTRQLAPAKPKPKPKPKPVDAAPTPSRPPPPPPTGNGHAMLQWPIGAPVTAPSGQSLILFEEVDLLYPSDKNFWAAVVELAKISRRPIILTCNDETVIPYEHLQLQAVIRYDRPDETRLLMYLHMICVLEGMNVSTHDLNDLIHLLGRDLRHLLLTLEMRHHFTQENAPLQQEHATMTRRRSVLDLDSANRMLLMHESGLDDGFWLHWLQQVPNDHVTTLCDQLLTRKHTSQPHDTVATLDDLQQWLDLRSWTDTAVAPSPERVAQQQACDDSAEEDLLTGYSGGHFTKQAQPYDHWAWDACMEADLLNWYQPDDGLLDTLAWECISDQRFRKRIDDQLDVPSLLNLRTTRVLGRMDWMDATYVQRFDEHRKANRKIRRRNPRLL
ncbi:hypothetical protein BC940DRAFT_287864 [Gongronella butleri]|nr:hypothetical protein BC940DRAFT_287864 [Gongronella butleri]